MSFVVGLRNLRIDCVVGVHARERELEQPVFLDVELSGDLEGAARGDAFDATIDYSAVAVLLTELVVRRRFELLEALALASAEALLDAYARVDRVTLEVRKPGAVPQADHAFVRVVRTRAQQI